MKEVCIKYAVLRLDLRRSVLGPAIQKRGEYKKEGDTKYGLYRYRAKRYFANLRRIKNNTLEKKGDYIMG